MALSEFYKNHFEERNGVSLRELSGRVPSEMPREETGSSYAPHSERFSDPESTKTTEEIDRENRKFLSRF